MSVPGLHLLAHRGRLPLARLLLLAVYLTAGVTGLAAGSPAVRLVALALLAAAGHRATLHRRARPTDQGARRDA
ncbi:hypothetical protein AB0H51_17260 [Streptomyces griseoluteus]|uniref:hypothetical protein n=1 Tax=Streptomyces griseoluteus TaxID=29306 RepID=UPI0033C6667E